MPTAQSISNGIEKRPYQRIVLYEDGNTRDIMRVVLYAGKKGPSEVNKIAHRFKGSSELKTAKNIWRFIRTNVRYVADGMYNQDIKSPVAVWRSKVADCKSMSVFAGSILHNLNIPYWYRFVRYNGNSKISHVYIVCGQDKGIVLDAVHHTFDEELPYAHKEDYFVTQIAYIRGPKGIAGLAETPQIRKIPVVPKAKYPHPFLVTTGALEGSLLKRRADLLYLNNPGDRTRNFKDTVEEIQALGIHSARARKILQHNLDPAFSKITRRLRKAARSQYVKTPNGINGIHGPDDGTVYNSLEEWYLANCAGQTAFRGDCQKLMRYAQVIMDRMEDGGYALLYHFITAGEANKSATIAAKRVLQNGITGGLVNISPLDSWHIDMMAENGILANGVRLPAVETYNQFKTGAAAVIGNRIGVEPASTALTLIITAIVAAAGAVKSILDSFKAEDRVLSGFPPSLGDNYQPEQGDFGDFGSGAGGFTEAGSFLPMLLIGGGAFMLYNSTNKKK